MTTDKKMQNKLRQQKHRDNNKKRKDILKLVLELLEKYKKVGK